MNLYFFMIFNSKKYFISQMGFPNNSQNISISYMFYQQVKQFFYFFCDFLVLNKVKCQFFKYYKILEHQNILLRLYIFDFQINVMYQFNDKKYIELQFRQFANTLVLIFKKTNQQIDKDQQLLNLWKEIQYLKHNFLQYIDTKLFQPYQICSEFYKEYRKLNF